MTIRQFLSILLNAGIFGNFASVSLVGWTGVFWCVALASARRPASRREDSR